MKVSRVIDYIDDKYIVTEDGKCYRRCTGDEVYTLLLCLDDDNDYYHESFIYNSSYKQFTVREISEDDVAAGIIWK